MSKKRALISVYDKTGIAEFVKELVKLDYEIISTGGTKKVLEQEGIACLSVEDVTSFPEMLDGRVKTLHPMIHGGLLAKRDNQEHMTTLTEHNIGLIDLVCVNLYPFKETIAQPDVTQNEAIEQIDIGGPSMLRSAAKNFASVTVIVDSQDYELVLQEMSSTGDTTIQTRQYLASKVFSTTSSYDASIARYLSISDSQELPNDLSLSYTKINTLRYGENNHQKAYFYQSDDNKAEVGIGTAKQLHGKELSYNNIKDANAAIHLVKEFEEPTVVAMKHMNPCGVGFGKTIHEAYRLAYESDPISIFGGVLAFNREIDADLAETLNELFLEIIIAPSFTADALELLEKKKNRRLLQLDTTKSNQTEWELVSVSGGLLIQESDTVVDDETQWTVVTETLPTAEEIDALKKMWLVVKSVKSNAIVVGNNHHTLGIGAGQMNRVGSVKLAVDQAGDLAKGAVLASDAFFPMPDSVEYAAKHGIKAIIHPGGSVKDQESIDVANEYGIAMIVTGTRHFKH
ncbi:bifunctional phosphoribosylaminoimidazolecarboxamide formyltransferase/IMP cyclohydrolase [Vagococcus bubulae]|uniref:Bifunctional purine biosynthesis protein PurH n=1 Tax=Vagococcus bubulae TaxID=1977868 RepID=A0A429ZIV8_9ENTE|nr:bifunctional phosphoribosylaminoimidazolecarboxamide formyltransferase/IMP cyclohydrolase [Vagococcus bubulae]RST93630.1 bifunctional phosphoribosylaminoimidazolecarboxamide formyltransferase/IMP cyclohydrolase [Vagococcus bubulae]